MNTKRSLYQPVHEEKSQLRNKRKPLAQGRLLQSRNASDGVYAPLQYGENNAAERQTKEEFCKKDTRGDASLTARGGYLIGTETATALGGAVPEAEQVSGVDPSTPRKNRPHTSFTHSPRAVQPSRSLDISDTDSEIVFNYKNNQSSHLNVSPHREVLVLDASQTMRGPRGPEVPLELGYKQSPAKVVCHSPGRVFSDLRDTGDVTRAAQIQVDHVPRVGIVDSAHDSMEIQHPKDPPMFKPTQVVAVHSHGTANVKEANPNMVKVLFNDPEGESEPAEQSAASTHTDDVEAVRALETSDESSASQDQSSVQQNTGNMQKPKPVTVVTKTKSATATSGTTPKSTKKKKAPRFVASRYMQTQPAGRKPMKATDRSIMTRSNVSSSSPSAGATRKTTGGVTLLQPRKTAPVRASSFRNRSGLQKSSMSKTPEGTKRREHGRGKPSTPSAHGDRGGKASTPTTGTNRGGKASTPTAESTTHVPEAVDISAIGPPSHKHHQNSFASPTLDESTFSTSSKYGARTRTGSAHASSIMARNTTGARRFDFNSTASSQDSAYLSKSKAKESPCSQLELDIVYARYLQWVFLTSHAKHSFEEQEKQFMSTTYELWQENERLRQQETELRLKLGRLQHANKLDEALDTQESGMSGVCELLPQLRHQYGAMATALDTTRHQIPTRGVHIPDNEQYFQESLQHAIEESEQLLSELSLMTRTCTPHVERMAEALHSMDSSAQTQVKQLRRCGELLAAADSLCTRESSLKIQQLQQSSPS